jgi:hypothetical protein
MLLPGSDPQPRLGSVERRRGVRPHRHTGDDTGRSVDATGNVTGHDDRSIGDPGTVDRRDRAGGRLARLAREPRPEYRVDDRGRSGEPSGPKRLRRGAGEALEVGASVAAVLLRRAQDEDVDVASLLAQDTRGDQPVAAVVALPADDGDPPVGDKLGHELREADAGALHQVEAGHPELTDRPLVERALLRGVGKGFEPVWQGHLSQQPTRSRPWCPAPLALAYARIATAAASRRVCVRET